MGLDMYLKAKRHMSAYNFNSKDEKQQYHQLAETVSLNWNLLSKESPSAYVEFTIAYWRKANHIHNWFVEHCQDGRDECQETYVTREKLQELVDLCKQVLAVETVEGDVNVGRHIHPDGTVTQRTVKGRVVCQQAMAEKLLPTASGFFFGQTDYDEYYLQKTQDTIDMIEPWLKAKGLDSWNLYYESSW